jgi:hypothetical protein
MPLRRPASPPASHPFQPRPPATHRKARRHPWLRTGKKTRQQALRTGRPATRTRASGTPSWPPSTAPTTPRRPPCAVTRGGGTGRTSRSPSPPGAASAWKPQRWRRSATPSATRFHRRNGRGPSTGTRRLPPRWSTSPLPGSGATSWPRRIPPGHPGRPRPLARSPACSRPAPGLPGPPPGRPRLPVPWESPLPSRPPPAPACPGKTSISPISTPTNSSSAPSAIPVPRKKNAPWTTPPGTWPRSVTRNPWPTCPTTTTRGGGSPTGASPPATPRRPSASSVTRASPAWTRRPKPPARPDTTALNRPPPGSSTPARPTLTRPPALTASRQTRPRTPPPEYLGKTPVPCQAALPHMPRREPGPDRRRPPRRNSFPRSRSCTATYRRKPPSKSPTTRTAHFGAPCATGSKLTAGARSGAFTRRQTPSGPARPGTSRTGTLTTRGLSCTRPPTGMSNCTPPGTGGRRRHWTPGSGSTEPTTSSTTPSAPPTTSTWPAR